MIAVNADTKAFDSKKQKEKPAAIRSNAAQQRLL
jgi:hypothetical protein